jgi:hypothetical protein
MPEELRETVAKLIRERQRIPQETLGLRVLRADPDLLRQGLGAAEDAHVPVAAVGTSRVRQGAVGDSRAIT